LNKVITATTLVGLFAIFALSGSAVPVHANTPAAVTYYVGSGGGCPGAIALTTSIPSSNTAGIGMDQLNEFLCVDNWTTALGSGPYTGPTFTITSITVTLFGCCESSSQFPYAAGAELVSEPGFVGLSSAPVADYSPLSTTCSTPTELILNPVPNAGAQLVNGQNFGIAATFGAGLYENQGITGGEFLEICSGGTAATASSITFSGIIPTTTPMPEFPLGTVALLAIGLPFVMILRTKYSAKMVTQ
jgi:hypothetical protein